MIHPRKHPVLPIFLCLVLLLSAPALFAQEAAGRWELLLGAGGLTSQNSGPREQYDRAWTLSWSGIPGIQSQYRDLWGKGYEANARVEFSPLAGWMVGMGLGIRMTEQAVQFQYNQNDPGSFNAFERWTHSDEVLSWMPTVYLGKKWSWGALSVGLEYNQFIRAQSETNYRFIGADGNFSETNLVAPGVDGLPPLSTDANGNLSIDPSPYFQNYGLTSRQWNTWFEFRVYPLRTRKHFWLSAAYNLPLSDFRDFNMPEFSIFSYYNDETLEELFLPTRVHLFKLSAGWRFNWGKPGK